ncbi:MAG: hypothetical protein KC561_14015, partial [Myxococcales bacterium]|nr:hypothetical protein [Myxococcales bacterium]
MPAVRNLRTLSALCCALIATLSLWMSACSGRAAAPDEDLVEIQDLSEVSDQSEVEPDESEDLGVVDLADEPEVETEQDSNDIGSSTELDLATVEPVAAIVTGSVSVSVSPAADVLARLWLSSGLADSDTITAADAGRYELSVPVAEPTMGLVTFSNENDRVLPRAAWVIMTPGSTSTVDAFLTATTVGDCGESCSIGRVK